MIRYDRAVATDRVDPHQYFVSLVPRSDLYVTTRLPSASIARLRGDEKIGPLPVVSSDTIMRSPLTGSIRITAFRHKSSANYAAVGFYHKVAGIQKAWAASGGVIRYDHTISTHRVDPKYRRPTSPPRRSSHHQTPVSLYRKTLRKRKVRAHTDVLPKDLPKERGRKKSPKEKQGRTG